MSSDFEFDDNPSINWNEETSLQKKDDKPPYIQAITGMNSGVPPMEAISVLFPNKIIGNDKILKQSLSSAEKDLVYRALYPPIKDDPNTPDMMRSKFNAGAAADILERFCDIEVFTTHQENPSRMLTKYDGLRYVGAELDVEESVVMISGRKVDKKETQHVSYILRSNANNRHYIENIPDHSKICNLMNGVADISGKEIIMREHSRKDQFFSVIPNEYIPNQRSDIYDEYLNYALDEKYHQFMYEWIGYLLFETYHMQKFIFHVGKGGNGKGTNDRAIGNVIGQSNQVNVPLNVLSHKGYDTQYLKGSLRNVMPEVDYKDMKNGVVILNQLSSNTDVIHAQVKYGEALEFINFARLEMTGNVLPKRYTEQTGFDRRMIQMEWMQPISAKDWAYYSNQKTGLYTQESTTGILSTALEAYHAIMRMDVPRFSYNPSINETSERYDRVSDPLGFFFDECLDDYSVQSNEVLTKNIFIQAALLYPRYEDYCKEHSLECLSKNKFNHSRNMPTIMNDRGIRRGTERIDGKSTRVWYHIQMKE